MAYFVEIFALALRRCYALLMLVIDDVLQILTQIERAQVPTLSSARFQWLGLSDTYSECSG